MPYIILKSVNAYKWMNKIKIYCLAMQSDNPIFVLKQIKIN